MRATLKCPLKYNKYLCILELRKNYLFKLLDISTESVVRVRLVHQTAVIQYNLELSNAILEQRG